MQIIHMPALFMNRAKPFFDAREQPVTDESVRRALSARDAERQRVLEALPPDAQQRMRDHWQARDDSREWASIVDIADLISQHKFGCTSRCLSIAQRETLLQHCEALLKDLDANPYK